MDTTSNIGTVQMRYEETVRQDQQSQSSRTSRAKHTKRAEVEDALSLAHMLQQLRTRRLDGDLASRGV